MSRNIRDISFGSFNPYNLQSPGQPWPGKPSSQQEYDDKVKWSAAMLQAMDVDVVALQELWAPQCLRDIVAVGERRRDSRLCHAGRVDMGRGRWGHRSRVGLQRRWLPPLGRSAWVSR